MHATGQGWLAALAAAAMIASKSRRSSWVTERAKASKMPGRVQKTPNAPKRYVAPLYGGDREAKPCPLRAVNGFRRAQLALFEKPFDAMRSGMDTKPRLNGCEERTVVRYSCIEKEIGTRRATFISG